jgi:hypothetical protein
MQLTRGCSQNSEITNFTLIILDLNAQIISEITQRIIMEAEGKPSSSDRSVKLSETIAKKSQATLCLVSS